MLSPGCKVCISSGFRLLLLLVAVSSVAGCFLFSCGRANGGAQPDKTKPAAGDRKKDEAKTEKKKAVPAVKKWHAPRFERFKRERDSMVSHIRRYGLKDKAALKAMAAVPRHEFVPGSYVRAAYADTPLPIGHGQTISQPYMVAEMTRLLNLTPKSKVLEVGTGSGYQAAVLTEFTRHVYTIEIIKPLADSAEKCLKRLGYWVVTVKQGDGYYGWKEKGPFDAIVVTCAAGQIPPPLIKQLKPGGRMVIPVGSAYATQSLMLVEKTSEGKVRSRALMGVRFVPLRRKDITKK